MKYLEITHRIFYTSTTSRFSFENSFQNTKYCRKLNLILTACSLIGIVFTYVCISFSCVFSLHDHILSLRWNTNYFHLHTEIFANRLSHIFQTLKLQELFTIVLKRVFFCIRHTKRWSFLVFFVSAKFAQFNFEGFSLLIWLLKSTFVLIFEHLVIAILTGWSL